MKENITILLNKLKEAQSYAEWLSICKELDEAENKEQWRARDESEYYNSAELRKALTELKEARIENNIPKLLYLVRTTFSRDIANMGDPRLYTQAHSGTKYLIEDYINECVLVLNKIVDDADYSWDSYKISDDDKSQVDTSNEHDSGAECNFNDDYEQYEYSDSDYAPDEPVQSGDTSNLSPKHTPTGSPLKIFKNRKMQRDAKKKIAKTLETLIDTRRAFGRTALVLSGGSILGFLHAGVTKELVDAKLLPKIISGSSSGSIFASVFCTRKDEELEQAWELLSLPMNIFEKTGNEESIMTHLKRFFTAGTWIDSSFLKTLMQQLIGDITFQEAFNRTGRILNVTVSVAGSHDMPRLLNYLTAPNVVIWSAVVCSCSVPLVFASDSIFAKDPKTKNLYPWSSGHFIDGSVDNDMPLSRLTEMFNVNHFIACQVNPHIAPLFRDTTMVEDSLSLSTVPSAKKPSGTTNETDSSVEENSEDTNSSSVESSEYNYSSNATNVVKANPESGKSLFGVFDLYSKTVGSPVTWIQRKISEGMRLGQNLMVKEVEHCLSIMKESGLGASAATVVLNVMNQDYWGDINIVPSIRWSDVSHLFKNPTTEQVSDLVYRGRQATWPKIAIIRNHCAVELSLDKAIYELNSRLVSIVGAEHQERERSRIQAQLHTPQRLLFPYAQHTHQFQNMYHQQHGGKRRLSSFNTQGYLSPSANIEHGHARSKSITGANLPSNKKVKDTRSSSISNHETAD